MRLIPQTQRDWLIASLSALGVLVAVTIAYSALWGWPTASPTTTKRPGAPLASASIAPNNVDYVRGLFGPWELAAPGKTGAPALVLLRHNGGCDVSSWSVKVDNSWHEADPTLISAVTPSESQVTLVTSDHRTFTLAYGQAFVLEAQPTSVYAFQRSGDGGYLIVETTLDRALRLGHRIDR